MRLPSIKRRAFTAIASTSLAALVFLSGTIATFAAPATRVMQALEGHSNTIFIRLFMWKIGIPVFLDSPLRGIGLGQIREWDQFVPFWRFDPMSRFAKGIGAHNDLLSYAVETGILGLAVLFWMFARIVKVGWQQCHWTTDRDGFHLLLAVWVPCLAIIVRFFYGTHIFYSLGGLFNCLFFGMLLALIRSMRRGMAAPDVP
jgi:O-antigen ligase